MNFGECPGDTNTLDWVSMQFDHLHANGGGWNSSYEILRFCEWEEENQQATSPSNDDQQATSTSNDGEGDSQSSDDNKMSLPYYLWKAVPTQPVQKQLLIIPQEQLLSQEALESFYDSVVDEVLHAWQMPIMECGMDEV